MSPRAPACAGAHPVRALRVLLLLLLLLAATPPCLAAASVELAGVTLTLPVRAIYIYTSTPVAAR